MPIFECPNGNGKVTDTIELNNTGERIGNPQILAREFQHKRISKLGEVLSVAS